MAEEAKQGDRRWLTLLLSGIVVGLLSSGAWAQTEMKRVVGSNVTLVPVYSGDPTEINWKVDGNKVVDMDLKPKLYIKYYRNEDRTNISPTDGRLTIRSLTIGDSGQYKAEVLVNNNVQETHINLIVRENPAKPTITDQSTPETINVLCNCPTPGVKYEWRNTTHSLSKEQAYTEPRPKEDVTLTCVAYFDEVFKNESSITFPYTPPETISTTGLIVAVIIVILIVIGIIGFLFYLKKRSKQGRQPVPQTEPERELDPRPPQEGRNNCGSILLDLSCNGVIIGYKLLKDGRLLYEVQLRERVDDQPRRFETFYLTVDEVKPEDYTAVAHLPSGDMLPIPIEDNRIAINVPDAKEVTSVVLKKRNDVHCRWEVCSSKLQSDPITLEPGSVTIHNLQPGDSGSYKVDVHSAENSITTNAFNLEVVERVNKARDERDVRLKVGKEVTSENGPLKKEPIGDVTFHPIELTNGAQVTWKKDNQPLDIECGKIKQHPNGDLTISKVTSADRGTYTAHYKEQKLNQTFQLI